MGKLSSLPDAHECRVDLEHVRDVLNALRSELVFVDTDNKWRFGVRGINGVNNSQMWAKGTNGEHIYANGSQCLHLISA